MIKIAFIGAGAVGGYFGSLMSKHYNNSNKVEVYFICKKSTAKHIEEHGLKLETTHGNYFIQPLIYSVKKNKSIIFDYIICCTKSYDLEISLLPLKVNIGHETVIIPLCNGVNSYEKIKTIFPDQTVWDACVYIISRIIEPGLIKETGGNQLLYFGTRDHFSTKLDEFEGLFFNAGIQIIRSTNIQSTIWEKFLFISSIATCTSYFNKSIGEILSNSQFKLELDILLLELKSLVDALGISLPIDVFESIYIKMQKLPSEATSSMHRDFKNGKQTELETLTGFVLIKSKELGISVPVYEKMYNALKTKF